MKYKKIPRILLVLLILLLQLLTACAAPSEALVETPAAPEKISTVPAEATSAFNDINPMFSVAEDEEFILQFNCDLRQGDLTMNGYVKVYSDAECKNEVSTELDTDYDKKTVTVKAPRAGNIPRMRKGEVSGEERSWGGHPRYYLVVGCDMESAAFKELSTPLRMLFTVASPVEVPDAKFKVSDKGLATIYWKAVNGAGEYKIYRSSGDPDMYSMELFSSTRDTQFDSFDPDNSVNSDNDIQFTANEGFQGYFFVSAVVDGKESRISDVINCNVLESQIPNYLPMDQIPAGVDTLSELPDKAKVRMRNFESTKNYNIWWDYENIKPGRYDLKIVAYSIPGTPFRGEVGISTVDSDMLKALIDGQKDQAANNGVMKVNDNIANNPPPVTVPQQDAKPARVKEQIPEGTTGETLEGVIKEALLKNEEKVSLAKFPEAGDIPYLKDLLQKILTQNPMILYEDEIGFDYQTMTLKLSYTFKNKKLIEEKQKEIKAKVIEVVGQVIKPGMSDYDKEKALHDYLVDNAEYDKEALKAAEASGFKEMPKGYEDSFNPYGILIKGVGVCQSYAEALKLLCDEAKLDCIVVTGTLNNVPHAWNKVKLDTMYYNIDATNNDNEILYPVFNASDKTISFDFTEDDQFELDKDIALFASINNTFDYYYVNKLTVSSANELKEMLIRAIDEKKDTFSFKIIDGDMTAEDIRKSVQEVLDRDGQAVHTINLGSFASVLYGRIER